MKNTSYLSDNVSNYGLYLINNGLSVGSKLKKNHGSFRTGNEVYDVTEITSGYIKAVCVAVNNPRYDQKRRLMSIIGSEVIIDLSTCGSFPEFVLI